MVVGKQEPQTAATIGPDPVGREAGSRRVRISGRLGAFQILKTPHEIEQAHRQDDAELREQDLARLPEGFDEQAQAGAIRAAASACENVAASGRTKPVIQASAVPTRTASRPPGIGNWTPPKYVSRMMPSGTSATTGYS